MTDLRDGDGRLFHAATDAVDLPLDAGEIGVRHGRDRGDAERRLTGSGSMLTGTTSGILIDAIRRESEHLRRRSGTPAERGCWAAEPINAASS